MSDPRETIRFTIACAITDPARVAELIMSELDAAGFVIVPKSYLGEKTFGEWNIEPVDAKP